MRAVFVIPIAAATASCQPAGFTVTPCQQEGTVAFALSDIQETFSSRAPRPDYVWVAKLPEGPGHDKPNEVVWQAAFPANEVELYENRPAMRRLTYGETPRHWDITQAPLALESDAQYDVVIDEGFGGGGALFRFDESLPDCEQL